MADLAGWDNFYVIVGSSAGALIGLQFVVLTLMADRPVGETTIQAADAFGTPNIIHFGAALLLSGIMAVPWQRLAPLAVFWGVLGISGSLYILIVARRMRGQEAYKPVFEDWLFHTLLPLAAYATLAVSAFAFRAHEYPVLFAIGGAALLLLFIGIHNAWDSVTYHVFVVRKKGQHKESITSHE